jgi:hypothetical protein
MLMFCTLIFNLRNLVCETQGRLRLNDTCSGLGVGLLRLNDIRLVIANALFGLISEEYCFGTTPTKRFTLS